MLKRNRLRLLSSRCGGGVDKFYKMYSTFYKISRVVFLSFVKKMIFKNLLFAADKHVTPKSGIQ